MDFKTAALSTVRGTYPGHIPYAPRFDLWFNAHDYRGTFPDEYRDCGSPLDIARKIGVGGHCVIADFIRPDDPSEVIDRGIGLYSLPQFPYRCFLPGVERRVTRYDDTTEVAYRTPKGTVTVGYTLTEDMRRAGASISQITKHALIGEKDIPPLAWLFEHVEVVPDYTGLDRMIDGAGGDALVVANVSLPGSPMQFIMRDLMDVTSFFFATADYPEKLRYLSDAIGIYFEKIMDIGVLCPSDILLFGANTDETITYPPFYEENIMPWIARFASAAHQRGKFVLIHADGENRGLFDLYRQSGIDILEAVATSPMTKCAIREVLERADGMTVWGGIPSVILMPETFGVEAFEAYMHDTLDAVGSRPQFILGVSDTTPPDADFARLIRIGGMVKE